MKRIFAVSIFLALLACAGSPIAPRFFDPAINGMVWYQPETIKPVTDRIDWMAVIDDGYGPGAFITRDRKEMLLLERQHDTVPPAIGTIGFIRAPADAPPTLKVIENIESFRTGKGIRLGMTEAEVTAILGADCMKRETINEMPAVTYEMGPETVCSGLRYRLFLKSIGLPDYAGSYAFDDGRLAQVWLESGQDY